ARRGGSQQHPRSVIGREHFVRDGGFFQSHVHHVAPGDIPALADGVRHFAGLAQAEPEAAALVTGHNQGAEAEAASAFDDLGGTIDVNHLFAQLVLPLALGLALGAVSRTSAPTRPAASRSASIICPGSDYLSHFFLLVETTV